MQEAKWMKGKGRREKLSLVWAAALCYVIRVRERDAGGRVDERERKKRKIVSGGFVLSY
jgi:hypothetical protein